MLLRSISLAMTLVGLAASGCGEAPDGGASTAAEAIRTEPPAPADLSAREPAPPADTASTVDPAAGAGPPSLPDPAAFTRVLREVVVDGSVDYAALQDRKDALDAYLDRLAATAPEALDASSPRERLAFWINAYNACMLSLVVENRPLQEAGGLWTRLKNLVAGRPGNSVWQIPDVFTRPHCRVAGEARSQDEIEHEIIRPMGDARIHFAVNCAARSCPVLAAEAYAAERLDAQLERQVARFMEDPQHYQLDVEDEGPVLRLNRVLEWFGEDFGGPGGLAEFFATRAGPAERDLLRDPELVVRFMEYDWTLNDVGA